VPAAKSKYENMQTPGWLGCIRLCAKGCVYCYLPFFFCSSTKRKPPALCFQAIVGVRLTLEKSTLPRAAQSAPAAPAHGPAHGPATLQGQEQLNAVGVEFSSAPLIPHGSANHSSRTLPRPPPTQLEVQVISSPAQLNSSSSWHSSSR
jgi:hypothetical protein